MVVLRLRQKQTRLFLTQPLKDSKNLFFRKKLIFHMQINSLTLSEFPLVYYIYLFLYFNILICFGFFCTPRHPKF